MITDFKKIIFDYASAQSEIKSLSKLIGESLNSCHEEQGNNRLKNKTETHLEEAYSFEIFGHEDGYGFSFREQKYDKPEEYLAETCQNCLKAHLLIQERKIAKQKFGNAKRQITRIGNLMMEGRFI